MAKPRLKISEHIFPSDQQLYDIIMSGKISIPQLQDFLRSMGIIHSSELRSTLASQICALVLDHEDLDKLVANVRTREGRIKTSVVELTAEGMDLNGIYKMLQDIGLPKTPASARVKLPSEDLRSPVFSKDNNRITFQQPFTRIDFGKTTLLQKQDHEFSYRIEEQATGSFKIVYSTSDNSSQTFFAHIRDTLEKKLKADKKVETSFYEITVGDLPDDAWNKFFDLLLKEKSHNLILDSGKSVQFVKGTIRPNDEDVVEDLDDTEQSLAEDDDEETPDEEKRSVPTIRKVGFEGKDIFKIKDIEDYKAKGFSIRSVVALFRKSDTYSSELRLQVSFGFNQYGKFISEIHKVWQVTNEAGSKPKSWNPPREIKESILEDVNRAAFAVFESVRQTKPASTSPIPVQPEALPV